MKLVANLALRSDVLNLTTGLLVNTEAVYRITTDKDFFSQRLFITPDDWKQVKILHIHPSQELYIEELTTAGVHPAPPPGLSVSSPVASTEGYNTEPLAPSGSVRVISRGRPLVPPPGGTDLEHQTKLLNKLHWRVGANL